MRKSLSNNDYVRHSRSQVLDGIRIIVSCRRPLMRIVGR
jgi:hypothetical protein